MAAKFAVLSGDMSESDESRQNALLDELGLPSVVSVGEDEVFNAMFSDKKAKSGKLRIVVPERIGQVKLVEPKSEKIVRDAIKFYCEK